MNEPQEMLQISEAEPTEPASKPNHDHLRAHLTSRLAAMLGILALGLVYLFLPGKLVIGPSWLLLVIEAILLLPMIASLFMQWKLPHRLVRAIGLVSLGLVTLALAIGIILLVATLNEAHGYTLLRSAGLMWVFNVLVFSLWYFEIDGGGPLQRHFSHYKAVDFMFPQQATEKQDPSWANHYLDYLFLAFTGATALSPADTYPLTRKAKALMMVEAAFSLIILVLLAARAVNILGS
jgi:uncharacterized membrane protein